MPYIPYTATTSIPATGVLTGQTSGNVFTFDVSPELNEIALQLGQIQYYLSGGVAGAATNEPGSMSAILSAQASALNQIMLIMQKATNTQDGHVTVITDQTEKLTTALATISGLMSQMIITQQMALVDQMHNNQFQQQVTNVSRQEAGLAPITVQDDDLTTKFKNNIVQVGTMQGQVTGTAAALNAVNSAVTQATTFTLTWLGTTTIGAYFVDLYTAAKLKIASWFGVQQGVNSTSTTGVATANTTKIGVTGNTGYSTTNN